TFLPWTRFTSETYLGYQTFEALPPVYSGLPGKLNLAANGFLFLVLILVYLTRAKHLARFYAFVVLLWFLPFSFWIFEIQRTHQVFMEYGILYELGASIACVCCSIGLNVALS